MKEEKIFKKHGIFIDSFREILSSNNGKQGQSSRKEILEKLFHEVVKEKFMLHWNL